MVWRGPVVGSWRPDAPPAKVPCRERYYRHAQPDYPPLWHPGNPANPAPQPAARWHAEGQIAQYLSSTPEGAWAELVRHAGIRTEQRRREYRHRLWRVEVEETDIADLSSFDKVAAAGLEPEMFVADPPYGACQTLAAELHADGYRGLLSPSAALHETTVNLTLFGPRREFRRGEANRRPGYYMMVSVVADFSAPPEDLLWTTRMLGEEHLGLADFKGDL